MSTSTNVCELRAGVNQFRSHSLVAAVDPDDGRTLCTDSFSHVLADVACDVDCDVMVGGLIVCVRQDWFRPKTTAATFPDPPLDAAPDRVAPHATASPWFPALAVVTVTLFEAEALTASSAAKAPPNALNELSSPMRDVSSLRRTERTSSARASSGWLCKGVTAYSGHLSSLARASRIASASTVRLAASGYCASRGSADVFASRHKLQLSAIATVSATLEANDLRDVDIK